jgi:hypothetical protein
MAEDYPSLDSLFPKWKAITPRQVIALIDDLEKTKEETKPNE